MAATFAPASRKQQMVLESKAQILVIGGAAGCVDADTEYLSPTGWKKISEYPVGGLVLQHDPYENKSTFVVPKEYIKIPCDTLTHFQAKGIDQCLSDEHRVLYTYSDLDTPKVLSFREVKRRHESSDKKGWTGRFPTTFNYSGVGIDITEGELRLQVAVMADGRIVKEGKDNYTQMRFAKKRKYDRLIAMCDKFGLRYQDNGAKPCERYNSGLAYEVIVWPKWSDKSFGDEYFNCSRSQLRIILDEVGYWDGTIVDNQKSKTVRYFNKHERNADFIQYAASATGKNATIVPDTRYGKEGYTVNIMTSGKGSRGIANKDGKIEMVDYPTTDGFKYCFVVDSSFFVMRRNGNICVTGNSGKSYLLQLMPLLIVDDPRTACIMFRRTVPQIRGQGGLFDKAKDIYNQLPPEYKPRFKENEMIATFPNGATVKWQSMQHVSDKYNIQGLEYTLIGVD